MFIDGVHSLAVAYGQQVLQLLGCLIDIARILVVSHQHPLAVARVVGINDVAVSTIGRSGGIAGMVGLYAQILSGIVAGGGARCLYGIDIILTLHCFNLPIRCCGRERFSIHEASSHAIAHVAVGVGAEEIVATVACVVGVEIIDSVGHGGRMAYFEAHGVVGIGNDGLSAPGFALSQEIAGSYIINIVLLVGFQRGEFAL